MVTGLMKRLLIIILLLIAIPVFARMMGAPMGSLVGAGVTVTDHFTYDNGELETTSAANFERWNTAAAASKLSVSSNQLLVSTGGGADTEDAIYVHKDSFTSENVYAQIKLTVVPAANVDGGLYINAADKGALGTYDGYFFSCYDDAGTKTLQIWKCTNGSWAALGAADTTSGCASGDILRIAHEADDYIRGYKNGVLIATGGQDTAFSATRVGFYGGVLSLGSTQRLDDFEGGDLR